MPLDRVVLDSNTWLSYFYYNEFEKLVEISEDLEVKIYTSQKQLQEIKAVLQRPKFKNKIALPAFDYINFIKHIAYVIKIDERFDRITDTNDNYLFDIAYTAKCSHVVTDDKAVLLLKHVGKI